MAFCIVYWLLMAPHQQGAEPFAIPNVHARPSDLTVPETEADPPAAGKRVRHQLPTYADWELHHVLYLPRDWTPQGNYPVIVEYPGNGGFSNDLGDKSEGRVEDCKLGFGISAGTGYVWLCLPFVDPTERRHALKWWGDADESARYCRAAVEHIIENFGGDRHRILLTGFSRGAIACGYIGLRNDEIAGMWRAMYMHSHYDGVRRWNYDESDASSARTRWRRFGGRPQYVTQEKSVDAIREFLGEDRSDNPTLVALPFPNHTDEWILKNLPERERLRAWVAEALKP